MRLRDILDESVIKIGLESIDKEECIEELVDVLVRAGCVADRDAALAAVHKRESEGTTGIGGGFAIPHGKCKGLDSLTIAIGTSRDGVDFEADDEIPAHVVFMILASENEPGRHLQALAEVVRIIRIPGMRRKLTEVDSASELLRILDAIE